MEPLDYSHPDDQTTQTTEIPGFKPFTGLRSLGRQSERLANNYISYASNVRRIRQQLWFNHRCKDLGLVPAGLRLKSPLNTQEAIQIVKATCRRLIKARINDCHRRLNCYNRKLQQRHDQLKQLIPTDLLDTIRSIANKRAATKDNIRSRVASTLQTDSITDNNLTKDEKQALKRLKNDENIVILPADKGRVTVVMDKKDYHDKMNELVNDKQT